MPRNRPLRAPLASRSVVRRDVTPEEWVNGGVAAINAIMRKTLARVGVPGNQINAIATRVVNQARVEIESAIPGG